MKMDGNPAFCMDEEHKYEDISHKPQADYDDTRQPSAGSRKKLVVGCVVASVICFIVGYGAGFGSAFAVPCRVDTVTAPDCSATATEAATVTEFEILAEGVPISNTVLSKTAVTTSGQCASLCRQQARCNGFGLDPSLRGGRACTLYGDDGLYATYLRHHPGTDYYARTDNHRPGFLYYPVLLQLNWAAARVNCQRIDSRARLVDVQTAEENDILFDLRTAFPDNQCSRYNVRVDVFTSGALVSGTWTWMSTGQPVRYTAWLPGRPNNHGGNEDKIGLFYSSGQASPTAGWDDVSAPIELCSLCKVAL